MGTQEVTASELQSVQGGLDQCQKSIIAATYITAAVGLVCAGPLGMLGGGFIAGAVASQSGACHP
jgi:hypothetical protein